MVWFNEWTFQRNQFLCQVVILWELTENILKSGKSTQKIAFRRFFSTTKNRYFFFFFFFFFYGTVRIPITWALRKYLLFFHSDVLFLKDRECINIKKKLLFWKKKWMTKKFVFFQKNRIVRKLFKNPLWRCNFFPCFCGGISDGAIEKRDEYDRPLLLIQIFKKKLISKIWIAYVTQW